MNGFEYKILQRLADEAEHTLSNSEARDALQRADLIRNVRGNLTTYRITGSGIEAFRAERKRR